MTKGGFFLLLVLFSTQSMAGENIPLKVVGNGLILVDCAQTYHAMKRPDLYREKNPLLGDSPSPKRVLATCAVSLVAVNVIDHYLDKKWSDRLWIGIVVVEGHAVYNNYRTRREVLAGLRVEF